jgi:hypothetical protein
VLRLAATVVAKQLANDRSDYVGPHTACPRCSGPARYAGRRSKQIVSVLGPLSIDRAYYHCAACATGYCPRDQALGVEDSSLSPAVTRMIAAVGALVSFAEGHELLRELAGVDVSTKQVERAAEELGRQIAEDERCVAEPPSSGTTVARTMYLGMDGTGVPMRTSELAGRTGKQLDGSAKTREVKLVTVWSAESRDGDGNPMRDPGSVTYSAAIESAASRDVDPEPSAFSNRAAREARRRGFQKARRRVVLGDGAPWIWNLATERFPGAIQIVDLYHAKGHLCEVAKAIYGPGTDLAASWGKLRRDELEQGRINAVITALEAHAGSNEEARRCVDYFCRNQSRMRYPQFRAHGLCVTSGVVEAGCKVAIGTRLKRAGMHWTLAGANAIAALRCCRLSGRFDQFWCRRSAARSSPAQRRALDGRAPP